MVSEEKELEKRIQQRILARMLGLREKPRPLAPQVERPRAEPAFVEIHKEHDFDRYR